MSTQRSTRTVKKVTRYFSTDEEENETNSSDSNFTPSQPCHSLLRKAVKRNVKRLHEAKESLDDSYCSQDSLYEAPKRRKITKKKISEQSDGDGSDFSFVFTDEISDVSFSKNQEPPKRKKAVKEKFSNKVRHRGKRKELSASRSTAKKPKLEDNVLENDLRLNLPVKSEPFADTPIKHIKPDPDTVIEQKNVGPLEVNSVKIKSEKISPIKNEERRNTLPEIKSEKPEKPIKIKSEKSNEKTLKIKSEKEIKIKLEKGSKKINKIKLEKETETEHHTYMFKREADVYDDSFFKESTEKKPKLSRLRVGSGIEWESSLLAEMSDVDYWLAKNVVKMFKNDCTVPFIARYRKEATQNMNADKLRHLKDAYEHIKTIESKAATVLKQIKKAGNLTKDLENTISHVRSLEELEFIYAPYKKANSKSKAEKAKALGLKKPALEALNGDTFVNPKDYVNTSQPGLLNTDEVILGLQHIIADTIAKDEDILDFIQERENKIKILMASIKSNAAVEKSSSSEQVIGNDTDAKFRIYYDFKRFINDIHSHQALAINRGESLKILSVKMTIDSSFSQQLYKFCYDKWMRKGETYNLRTKIFNSSYEDSYKRLISPLITRRARSKLTRQAQHSAIENFAVNLKNLLQTQPVKGCTILGIDPGIRNGMKVALISSTGEVIWTEVLYFNLNDLESYMNEQNMNKIKDKMLTHSCELISVGNGKGCRPMERIISDYLKKNFFDPLNVKYTIVNERGASIYSCSPIAEQEFPDLDPNMIGAVFIARSLQDPLSEFVKVEPKHLGVGMYQHDMPEKQLHQTLDEIVTECVSFTGVDVNLASFHLLKRVAGLNPTKATNIIEWRRQNGPFMNREQLNNVKGIGPKSYEQCAGFIRIHPQTCQSQPIVFQKMSMKKKPTPCNNDVNPLDRTWIHPESYAVAYRFLNECKVNLTDLGSPSFIDEVKKTVEKQGVQALAQKLEQTEELINLIYDALIKPNDYDYRSEFAKPVFSEGLTDINSLSRGLIVQGRVSNVCNFGAFIDIGIGKDALLHKSNTKNRTVQVGDQLEVRILDLEKHTYRVSLGLIRKL